MNIKQKIGKKIKELRKEQNLTQIDLAAKCGLDRTYINSVENGRRNISIVNLEKMSIAFDIELASLFEF
jgi:transcriptional regulator with XRE-family HTH domain